MSCNMVGSTEGRGRGPRGCENVDGSAARKVGERLKRVFSMAGRRGAKASHAWALRPRQPAKSRASCWSPHFLHSGPMHGYVPIDAIGLLSLFLSLTLCLSLCLSATKPDGCKTCP